MKQGWEIKKLEEVCIKITDGSHNPPKGIHSSDFIMLSSKNIFDDLIHFEDPRYLTQKDFESENKRTEIQSNDVLLTIVGTIGRVAVVSQSYPKFTLQRSVAVLKIKEEILDSRFLMFSLQNILQFLTDEARGVAQKGIYLNQLKAIEIPIPPLSEQQRIVSILDEAFATIAKAKANAEQNLRNAKEVFDCYLLKVLSDKKWETKTIGDVCIKVEYGSATKSKNTGKIAVLRMGNIQNGRFDWEKLVYSDDEKDNKQYLLKYNDVLFNRTNSPELVGKTAIYKGEMPAIFAGYLIRLHRKEDLIDADFLNYYLNSEIALEYGKTVVISSVNQANINGTKLKGYPIPCPPLKEQQTIVQKLDALSTETKKLEAIYQQKIDDLEEMKKSILEKAFSGQMSEL